MLASPADFALVRWPMYASPKLDGIRAVVHEGVLKSRSLKPIPNAAIRMALSRPEFEGLDGELIVGDARAPDCFRTSTSGVMSIDGESNWSFHVFDRHLASEPWHRRWNSVENLGRVPNVRLVAQTIIASELELTEYELAVTSQGYEGVMLRCPSSPYKYGRSTAKEGFLLKVKRFVDGEARVVAVIEEQFNGNEATTNELGRTKRSSHQENKVGKGRMGALLVEDLETKVQFQIGTGFDDADKASWWACRSLKAEAIVKYKHFPVGAKDKPRHPVFLGVRDRGDMS
jgi:DNA ligase-1